MTDKMFRCYYTSWIFLHHLRHYWLFHHVEFSWDEDELLRLAIISLVGDFFVKSSHCGYVWRWGFLPFLSSNSFSSFNVGQFS